MCGFAGFLTDLPCDRFRARQDLVNMCNALIHRGPDDDGYWYDDSLCVGLGHRRLAVLDISPTGAQPMRSSSGRWAIAFNGEIYNHLELRRRIDCERNTSMWSGHSDTETLLSCFDAWGIEKTVHSAIGMFAFAVWDRDRREITLVRDRIGEKPLYYGWQGSGSEAVFLFGSDLAALRAHSSFNSDLDRESLCLYMRFGCIGSDRSIYCGIRKLPPGRLLTLAHGTYEPVVRSYWSVFDVVENEQLQPFNVTVDNAIDTLDSVLSESIGQQMVADVPLGAFLSGGIDSSTVVALMQRHSSRPVRTFSIGFHVSGYNEAEHAKAVARHLGTEHTELYVTPEDAMAVIPKLPELYSEPFADSSQIPAFLVSQLARQHITVALSGDGGDELFGGYNRYVFTQRWWGILHRIPLSIKRIVARSITGIAPEVWNRVSGILPYANVGDKLHKGAMAMACSSAEELYYNLTSHWEDPLIVVDRDGVKTEFLSVVDAAALRGLSAVERMMAMDLMNYLPDDILCKVDRASMGISLETRVPMLDHRVVEFALGLPLTMKIRDGQGKWILRQVLYRYVPRELIERPKMGFAVPIDSWLRGPLREWAEDLLDASRLRQDGYFKPEPIRKKWQEHLSGRHNWQQQLWNVLMFQAWLRYKPQS